MSDSDGERGTDGSAEAMPGVIADDLTGALDTGVRFRTLGREVRVISRFASAEETMRRIRAGAGRVWVVNTRSRHDPPERAAARVGSAAAAMKAAGLDRIYKKCDSTLRGNLGAELAALASVYPDRAMLLVPAFPAMGRTTRNGIHYVDGVPLAESSFSKDALNPVLTSSISELIGSQCGLPVIAMSSVRFAADPAGALVPGAIIVPDAETEKDLSMIAAALASCREAGIFGSAEADARAGSNCVSGRFPILAGSAGLAAHIAMIYGYGGIGRAAQAAAPRCGFGSPMLVVVGSRHEVSRTQARFALAQGFFEIVAPRAAGAADGGGSAYGSGPVGSADGGDLGEIEAAADRAAAPLASGKDCLIHDPRKGDSELVKQTMAALAARILRRATVGTLVVFGGDTLEAALDALGAETLEPLGEFDPGIVRCAADIEDGYADDGAGRRRRSPDSAMIRLNLVTKAGGFGAPDLLPALKTAQEQKR